MVVNAKRFMAAENVRCWRKMDKVFGSVPRVILFICSALLSARYEIEVDIKPAQNAGATTI